MAKETEYDEEFDTEEEEDRGDDFETSEDEDEEANEEEENLEDEDEEVDEDSNDEDSDDDKDADEEEDEDEEDTSDTRIPKARLDQVIEQREREKERSAWLEQQLEKIIEQNSRDKAPVYEEEEEEEPFDYDAAEAKYAELLMEGESVKAAKVRALVNTSRQQDIETLIAKATEGATKSATSKSSELYENGKFEDLIGVYEAKHTFLNVDHDDFDEELVDTINVLISGYVASGKTKREGLRLAIAKSLPTQTEEPKKKKLGGKRVKASRKKNADASNNQPPKTRSAKQINSTATTDVSKMSDKQYNNLTQKEKRALRGD